MPNRSTKSPEGSFVEAFLRHQRSIHAFVLQLVHDHDDAEDLLQRTGLVLWKKFDQYTPGTDFLAWARQIAKFEVQRHLRSARKRRLCFAAETIELLAEEASDGETTHDDRHDALRRCLDGLRPTDRELVRRCYESRGTVRNIATELGRTADGIYHSLHRIRQALLRCIERRLAEEART